MGVSGQTPIDTTPDYEEMRFTISGAKIIETSIDLSFSSTGTWRQDSIDAIVNSVFQQGWSGYLAYVGTKPTSMDVVITEWPDIFDSGVPREWTADLNYSIDVS